MYPKMHPQKGEIQVLIQGIYKFATTNPLKRFTEVIKGSSNNNHLFLHSSQTSLQLTPKGRPYRFSNKRANLET